MKCICAECGITKSRFVPKSELQEGKGFDELIVKGLAAGAKGLSNVGRRGASEAIKSDFARNKIKSIGRQYLDQLVDSTTNSLSKKIAGKGVAQAARQASGAGVVKEKMYKRFTM